MAPRYKSKTASIAILISVYVILLTGHLSQRGVNAQLKDCGCSSTYTPVCAGGKTYNNACLAKCDGMDPSTPGACNAPKPAPPPYKDCSNSICPALYDPVCGEDNGTYDNTCLAACVGVAVKYRGECGSAYPPESPDSPLAIVPNLCESCPADNKPVCGSDGKTYPNVCNMQCLSPGVTVDYNGRCADPTGCANVQCTTTYSPVCGANGRTYPNRCIASCTGVTIVNAGVCNASQCVCPPNVDQPVCGRDGVTYNSPCQAAFCAGVGVAYFGPCETDGTGCAAVVCPAVYSPVCGTDNRTYANSCLASCSNVTVARRSPCDDTAARVPYSLNSLCGGCTREYRPVCGTNGKTYPNPCQAVKCANVSIAYEGACEDAACNMAQCDTLYDPLCGLNGKEYRNLCTAECYGVSFQPGVCRPVASPNPPRPPRPLRPPRPSPPPRPPSSPPPSPRPPRRPPSPRVPRPPPRRTSSPPPPSPSPVYSPPRKLNPTPAGSPSPGANSPPASSLPLVPSQPPASQVSSPPPLTSSSPLPPIPADDMDMAPVDPMTFSDSGSGSGSGSDSGSGLASGPGSDPNPGSDPSPEWDPAQHDCPHCDPNYVRFVCGANGLSYQNACFADCLGVQVVDARRACRPSGASRANN